MKKLITLRVLSVLALGLMASPIQADFIQCGGGGPCNGTDNSDVINGNSEANDINAGPGDDIAFGNEGEDSLQGDGGNDILFGGPGDDDFFGNDGNDIILAGPDDDLDSGQFINGDGGNDITHVLVGEILGCLSVFDNGGADVVNLIGFGPYSAQAPFGQPGFGNGVVVVMDPITNGVIAIEVSENDDSGVETINGLLTPNVTIENDFPDGCPD
jgi:hypothetical protein